MVWVFICLFCLYLFVNFWTSSILMNHNIATLDYLKNPLLFCCGTKRKSGIINEMSVCMSELIKKLKKKSWSYWFWATFSFHSKMLFMDFVSCFLASFVLSLLLIFHIRIFLVNVYVKFQQQNIVQIIRSVCYNSCYI